MLDPVLFILYTTSLTALIEKHCSRHEMFAIDTQLSHSELSDLVCSLQNCVKDIGLRMEENKLTLNSDNNKKKTFVSQPPLQSSLPYSFHTQLLTAILKLSSLELSTTSASSLLAIFQ